MNRQENDFQFLELEKVVRKEEPLQDQRPKTKDQGPETAEQRAEIEKEPSEMSADKIKELMNLWGEGDYFTPYNLGTEAKIISISTKDVYLFYQTEKIPDFDAIEDQKDEITALPFIDSYIRTKAGKEKISIYPSVPVPKEKLREAHGEIFKAFLNPTIEKIPRINPNLDETLKEFLLAKPFLSPPTYMEIRKIPVTTVGYLYKGKNYFLCFYGKSNRKYYAKRPLDMKKLGVFIVLTSIFILILIIVIAIFLVIKFSTI